MISSYKEALVMLLFAHVLADFYFQTKFIAQKKEKNFRFVVVHSVIYGLVNLVWIKLICFEFENIYLWTIIISHFMIDALKYFIKNRKLKNEYDKYIFVVDQLLHLIILLVICYLIIDSGKTYEYNKMILDIFNAMGLSLQISISFFTQLLLIHKPVNIFIVKMMQAYKPTKKDEENTIKAGRMIGTIERIIMLFFLLINQYSSVGLVLTAKSIARYNKIAEDQEFAEYYLLGTLLSTICVLVVSLI